MTPRRRWSAGEKVHLIESCMGPRSVGSLMARTYSVAPNLLYRWRKQMSEGGKTATEANDEVVSVAEVKALKKRIRQLEARSRQQNTGSGNPQRSCSHWPRKKLISRLPLSGVEDFQ